MGNIVIMSYLILSIVVISSTCNKYSMLIILFSMFQLDTAVLMFQNQKLSQKLEAQKLEISALEIKLSQHKEKQQSYDRAQSTVNNRLEKVWLAVFAIFSVCFTDMLVIYLCIQPGNMFLFFPFHSIFF